MLILNSYILMQIHSYITISQRNKFSCTCRIARVAQTTKRTNIDMLKIGILFKLSALHKKYI